MELVGKTAKVVNVKPEDLKEHPRNTFFFPAMDDDSEFEESVKERGIINMPIITNDMIIVSGHRRIRAAKKAGIAEITCQMREYNNDDEVLYDLIASNVMSRAKFSGLGPIYASRVVMELKRLYHNNKGDNTSELNIYKSVPEMAQELGTSKPGIERANKIATIDNELADKLIGNASAQTLLKIAAMSEKDQLELCNFLEKQGLAGAKSESIKEWISEYESTLEENEELEDRLERAVDKINILEEKAVPNANLNTEIRKRQEIEAKYNRSHALALSLQEKIKELKQQLSESNTTSYVVRDVVPADYEEIKSKLAKLEKEKEQVDNSINIVAALDNAWKSVSLLCSNAHGDATFTEKLVAVQTAINDLHTYTMAS